MRLPESLDMKQARAFLEEVRPLLEQDRPQVVFDLSEVLRIDAAGVEMLLDCMKLATRRDGDLKLASLSPQAQIVLDLTRASRLFEIYASSAEAVRSFSVYVPNVVRQIRRQPTLANLNDGDGKNDGRKVA
jgi:anti-sigma B factor antagonist